MVTAWARHNWAMGAATAVALACGLAGHAAAQQPGQGSGDMEPPKWLSDDGKELFTSLEHDFEEYFADDACETREKLLKHMAGRGEKDAAMHRSRVLLGLSICEYKKGNFGQSKRRFLSTIADMESYYGSEDNMLKMPPVAPIPLMKQAAEFMDKHELTQAGTALRRCREIMERNLKKILKQLHQNQQVPIQLWYDELSGYGKTGTYLPQIKKQFPIFKQELSWLELLDISLEDLDRRMVSIDKAQKAKRSLLQVSKGKGGGTLLYVRALFADATIAAERLVVAQELGSGVAAAFEIEAASAEKSATLVKRSKEGAGCQKEGLEKTCKALLKVPDVKSNGFGETRLLVVKAGKKQSLDVCSTNANLGVLLAAKDGLKLSVSGAEEVVLKAGEPVALDFCRESALESTASAAVPVLFAQVWHPEFAAVERTTELRGRAEAFGLSESEVKEVTKVVNDHAKYNWDKAARKWREGSPGIAELKATLKAETDEKARTEQEAAEAKRKEEEAGDEERQKALEELKKKREAKAKAAADKEEARKRRQKVLEEERARRDPWLSAPEVKAVEAKIDDLKEQRRDANAKLEFDLSTQLTKDISAAERQLKKTIKKAKKEYQKSGAVPTGTSETASPAKEEAKPDGELAKLKAELKSVKEKKTKASQNEDFKEAKKLKQQQQELESKIAKLEL